MAKLRTSGPVGVSRDALRRRADKRAEQGGETTKKAARTALNEDSDAAIKIYEPAARLKGGPRDGAVYYVSDLEQQKRAAEAMGRTFDYRPTGTHITLPWTGGVEGVVWRYCGAS